MKASATARVLVQINNLGSWDDECTVEQIKKQAEDAVKSRLCAVLPKCDGNLVSTVDVKIILED